MANFLSSEGLKLSFPIEPVPVQSARFYRAGKFLKSYQPEKITSFKQFLRIYALQQLPEGFQLFDSPIALEADFVFLPPQSLRKKELAKIAAGEIVYKATRGDVDNLSKGLFDSLNKLVWKDDALIVDYHVRKYYGKEPCINVSVFPL